jgi:hypothetical protein
MPPFNYEPYRNPYAGTIGEILQQRGQIAARQAEQVGGIQARAAEQSGAAWAGVAQGLGLIPGQVVAQQRAQVVDQAAQLRLEDEQKARATRDAFVKILATTPLVDEDGVSLYDTDTIAKQLTFAGLDPTEAVTRVNGLNQGFRADRAGKLALVKRGAEAVAAAGNHPDLARHFLDTLERNRIFSKDELDQYRQFLDADPETNTAKLTAYLGAKRELATAPSGSTIYDKSSGDTVAKVPEDAHKGDYTGQDGIRYHANGRPVTGEVMTPQVTPAAAQTHNMRLKGVGDVPVDYVPNKDGSGGKWMYQGEDVSGRVSAIPPASVTIRNENARGVDLPDWALDERRPTGPDANVLDKAIRMTPNGLYQAAQTYIATGSMPPTGRGTDPIAVAQRAAISSKVGAIAAAAGMDVPTLRAFFTANKTSLTEQQKMLDAVQGFMETADKNAAKLKELLPKVPDWGRAAFNQPLRLVASRWQGDPVMGAFLTYLQSVQNEYGRIVAQPNLSGQLTDSARHEAEVLIDKNQNVATILASLAALETEGTNRVGSIADTIKRIQGRMQGESPAPAGMMRVLGPNGEKGTMPMGTPLPTGWKKQ